VWALAIKLVLPVDGFRDPQKTDRRFVTSQPTASGREVHRVARRP
jgi:hypothetical protein